ncbi:MAG TPA: histidine phosphatase family protein [Chondromyces sp.]|nr:histidine phosphatase family protein [Chondromyces sp.]
MDDIVVIGLYRHGMTTCNERNAFSGWTNSILSEKGKKELYTIQPQLPDYERIIASDLQRCVDTAAILFPQHTAELRPEFREMNFGFMEGKVHDELKELKEYNDWIKAPLTAAISEGESYPEFRKRVLSAWKKWLEEIAQTGIRRQALVAHGGVLRSLLTEIAPVRKEFYEWKSPNGRGYELTGSLSALRRGERCISLREVPSTGSGNGQEATMG